MRRLLKNPMTVLGILLVGGILAAALLAPLLPLPSANETRLDQRLLPPGSPGHILGTDQLGRDLLARLLEGARVSIAVAAAATIFAALVGSLIGMIAGYAGRWLDTVLMRTMDVALAFPYIILALAIVAILGPGLLNALIAIALVNVPFFARTTRAVTLSLSRRSFVEAARLAGQGHSTILLRELLPNVLPTVVIAASTTFGWMILETAGLSFLGLGAQPPQADLGSMLADSRTLMLVAPHTGLLPGLVILALVLGLNLIGDGVRDLLDPKLRGTGSIRPQPATRIDPRLHHSPDSPATGLRLRDLGIHFRTGRHRTEPGISNVSIDVAPGQSLGLVGESGSGKSLTAMAVVRLVPSPPAVIHSGTIQLDRTDLLGLPPESLRQVRGRRIGFVFQDPQATLNPLETIGFQLDEAILCQRPMNRRNARAQSLELLRQVDLPQPEWRLQQYPHQLSGGQRQRVAIAIAIANEPELLIADEPTTALDVTVQKRILTLLDSARQQRGSALLFISHDLSVVRQLCDHIAVMKDGTVVEQGPTRRIIQHPEHPYTRHLLECSPRWPDPTGPGPSVSTDSKTAAPILVRAEQLSRTFRMGRHPVRRSRLTAVDAVDLEVRQGHCLGIVGGSGSGKTTLIRLLSGLSTPSRGTVHCLGRSLSEWRSHRREIHRNVQFVFQDPSSAFNPRRTLRAALETPLRRLTDLEAGPRRQRIRDTLETCRLDPASLDRYPHEFSGGESQRLAIARALLTRPRLLFMDEPLSALDVSVQRQILDLLASLRRQFDLTILFVSHDLTVVGRFCDQLLVMHDGRAVEHGSTTEILRQPRHPATRELIDSASTL